MKMIGITGGIGSGKSTVAHLFEAMGYPIYYADLRARWLMDNDPIIKELLIESFGIEVYPDKLNRPALAAIVFNDKASLYQLNNITHPTIEEDFDKWCKIQESPIVFKEAAVMFESGTDLSVHEVICVTAPEKLRIRRVMDRDKVSEQDVKNRIRSQWSDEKKIALSQYVIMADDHHLVVPQAISILHKIQNKQKMPNPWGRAF